ncbi:diguanylate cyclase (GGDEF) domain-containing protein [Marinobacter sp. es.042]|uniref:bifunctional diguanylate cyclase/phosphodiesterase n=1 Tax=Marinobacter sp. es.042 TaxID=1761794 RepID=UPI000B5F4240|nr:EAL domain-containing protein [Marinobacter sp. es.042]SNB58768.1 diguanylate cyclase (GGDEF) domain-containing protein [Marinobacter sp. es.042]
MEQPVSPQKTVVSGLLSPLFPVVIFLVFLGLAAGLRYGLVQQDKRQIEANLANEARAMANHLAREFLIHAEAIRRMAERLETAPDITEQEWRQDARNYLDDFGVYQAIEWIDSDFVIRWLEPFTDNEEVIGYNVAFNEERRQALELAKQSGTWDLSGVINLRQGGKGMVIYAPVGAGPENNGFMAGVFRMEVLARQLLTERVLESFRIEIREAGEVSYELNVSQPVSSEFSQRQSVNLPTLDWTLTLRPSVEWVDNQYSDWPALTFTTFLLMGLLTSLTTLLVQLILKRNQALLKTRRELDQEMEQRTAIQKDLARLESTDTLTGLANRRFFMEDLSHTLNIADRQMRQVALVMLDLDRFQTLNDSLGHQFGDELLIKVSERLNRLSNERLLVAYSGGDEFMFCQQQVDDIDDIIHLLGQIKQCFDQPYEVQGQSHSITGTMGVAVYPQSGLDADTLLRNADIALYRAKEQGRNTYQFYTEGMQEREVMRLELDKDLSQALANNEFVLFYQPQLNLDTGEIQSVEALIRWRHPRRGLLPPVEFIPLAEESGRITDIGRWVVMAACRQLAAWKGSPQDGLRIAVNLSGRELDDEDLVDHIREALAAENVPADRLEVELTEEIFIQNIEHNRNQLSRLHQLGVNLAIDDFGVGYSSLGYLRDFPVDLLKIDRSFITEVTERHDDAVITRAVINLAHNLGIQVVAEGVETEEQLSFLKNQRCNFAQGYLISRPIPVDDLEKALASGVLVAGITADSGL